MSSQDTDTGAVVDAVTGTEPEQNLTIVLLGIVFGAGLALFSVVICIYYIRAWCRHQLERRRNRRQVKALSMLPSQAQLAQVEVGSKCGQRVGMSDPNANEESLRVPMHVTDLNVRPVIINIDQNQNQNRVRSSLNSDEVNANIRLSLKNLSGSSTKPTDSTLFNNNDIFTIGSDCSLDFGLHDREREEIVYIMSSTEDDESDPEEKKQQKPEPGASEKSEAVSEVERPVITIEDETEDKEPEPKPEPGPKSMEVPKPSSPPAPPAKMIPPSVAASTYTDVDVINPKPRHPLSMSMDKVFEFVESTQDEGWLREKVPSVHVPAPPKCEDLGRKAHHDDAGAGLVSQIWSPMAHMIDNMTGGPEESESQATVGSESMSVSVSQSGQSQVFESRQCTDDDNDKIREEMVRLTTPKKSVGILTLLEFAQAEGNPWKDECQPETEPSVIVNMALTPEQASDTKGRSSRQKQKEKQSTSAAVTAAEGREKRASSKDRGPPAAAANGVRGSSDKRTSPPGAESRKLSTQRKSQQQRSDDEEEVDETSIGNKTTVTETTEEIVEHAQRDDKAEEEMAEKELEDLLNFDAAAAVTEVEKTDKRTSHQHGHGHTTDDDELLEEMPEPKKMKSLPPPPKPSSSKKEPPHSSPSSNSRGSTKHKQSHRRSNEVVEVDSQTQTDNKLVPITESQTQTDVNLVPEVESQTQTDVKLVPEVESQTQTDVAGTAGVAEEDPCKTVGVKQEKIRCQGGATVTVTTTVNFSGCGVAVVNCGEEETDSSHSRPGSASARPRTAYAIGHGPEEETDSWPRSASARPRTAYAIGHGPDSHQDSVANPPPSKSKSRSRPTSDKKDESETEFAQRPFRPALCTTTSHNSRSHQASVSNSHASNSRSKPTCGENESYEDVERLQGLALRPTTERVDLRLSHPLNIRDEDSDEARNNPSSTSSTNRQGCTEFVCKEALPKTAGSYGMITLLDFMQAEGGPAPHDHDGQCGAIGFMASNIQSLWETAKNALPGVTSSSLITVDTSRCVGPSGTNTSQRASPEVIEVHKSNAFKYEDAETVESEQAKANAKKVKKPSSSSHK